MLVYYNNRKMPKYPVKGLTFVKANVKARSKERFTAIEIMRLTFSFVSKHRCSG